jgi:hypothetical protein
MSANRIAVEAALVSFAFCWAESWAAKVIKAKAMVSLNVGQWYDKAPSRLSMVP